MGDRTVEGFFKEAKIPYTGVFGIIGEESKSGVAFGAGEGMDEGSYDNQKGKLGGREIVILAGSKTWNKGEGNEHVCRWLLFEHKQVSKCTIADVQSS
jgi:hypothetical protein